MVAKYDVEEARWETWKDANLGVLGFWGPWEAGSGTKASAEILTRYGPLMIRIPRNVVPDNPGSGEVLAKRIANALNAVAYIDDAKLAELAAKSVQKIWFEEELRRRYGTEHVLDGGPLDGQTVVGGNNKPCVFLYLPDDGTGRRLASYDLQPDRRYKFCAIHQEQDLEVVE